MSLIREQGHKEVTQNFDQNLGPKLIQFCNKRAKQVRMRTANQATSNNTRCYGEQVLIKAVQITSMPTKGLIREIDSEEEKKE